MLGSEPDFDSALGNSEFVFDVSHVIVDIIEDLLISTRISQSDNLVSLSVDLNSLHRLNISTFRL